MKKDTSWENSAFSYHKKVGQKGHEYHQKVILPPLLSMLALDKESSLLDLGCGQGILSRHIPKIASYVGLDASPSLIKQAINLSREKTHTFLVQDLSKKISLDRKFSHACFLLSLQNMASPLQILEKVAPFIEKAGKIVFVLNHPCFRIPRQSSWGYDERKKLQYRRIDSYLSFLEVPIQMEPGKDPSKQSISFHFSLQDFMQALKQSGFFIEDMKELCSHKESVGKKGKVENRARKEFPLFLAVSAIRL